MENTLFKNLLEKLEEELEKTRDSLSESAKEVEIERIKAMSADEFKEHIGLDAAYVMRFNVRPDEQSVSLHAGNAYPFMDVFFDKEEKEQFDKLFKEELPEFLTERITAILGEDNVEVEMVVIENTDTGDGNDK